MKKRYPNDEPRRRLNTTALLVLTIAMTLQIADVITTEMCLARGGQEGNPVMAWLFNRTGRPCAHAIKLSVILCLGMYAVEKGWPLSMLVGQSAVGPLNNLMWLIENAS